MKEFFKTIFSSSLRGFLIALFTFVFLIGFTAFAINLPGNIPNGENSGGFFSNYFDKIFYNCPSGKILQGYNVDKDPICVPYTQLVSSPNFTFNYVVGSDRFNIGWIAGVNIGSCKIEMQSPSTSNWVDTDGIIYDCDSDLVDQEVIISNKDTKFASNWSNVLLRIVKTSDLTPINEFTNSLNCISSAGISTSDNIDQDCNGIWNNPITINQPISGCPSGYSCRKTCYSNIYNEQGCTNLVDDTNIYCYGNGTCKIPTVAINIPVNCNGESYCCGGSGMTISSLPGGLKFAANKVEINGSCSYSANITKYY